MYDSIVQENDAPPRLLLVGLDAFPVALLDEWTKAGDLPNLAALIERSERGSVNSVAKLLPGSTWPTFSSMTPPDVHGVYSFLQWDPARMTYRRPGADWCPFVPFWDRLSAAGIPTVAFDVPFTNNDLSTRAINVHGWGLHDEMAPPFSHPTDLLADLRKNIGASPIEPDVLGPKPVEMLRTELDLIVKSVPVRTEIIRHLANRFDWRVFVTAYSETHRVGHYFWTERSLGVPREGLRRVARAVDAELPKLQALLRPQDQLVVFALHGMGDFHDLDRFSEAIAGALSPEGQTAAAKFDPVRFLNNHVPQGPRRAISAALPTRVRDRLFGHYLSAGKDWSRTRVVSQPPDGNVFLRLNVQGREAQGAIPADQRAAVVEEITEALRRIRDEEGVQLIETFEYPNAVYTEGPNAYLLPDISIKSYQRPVPDRIVMGDGTKLHVPWRGWRDGDHRPDGFYLRSGGGIAPGPASPIESVDMARYLVGGIGLTL